MPREWYHALAAWCGQCQHSHKLPLSMSISNLCELCFTHVNAVSQSIQSYASNVIMEISSHIMLSRVRSERIKITRQLDQSQLAMHD